MSNESLVAMLTAYFDESWNHRTDKNQNDPLIYTVACWLSPVEQWKKFSKKWKSALRSAGIEDFHMKEYESRLGEYAEWPDLKRVGVLKRLHRIIKDHTIYGCSFSIDRTAFDELITPDWKRAFATKSYYGFTVFACLNELSERCDQKGYDERIHHVFAHMKGQGSDLDAIFNYLLKRPRLRDALRLSGTWTKGFARDIPQLQAADIVAYEINKHISNIFGGGTREIRKSLFNLHLDTRGVFKASYFGREEIAGMMSDFRQGKVRDLEQTAALFKLGGNTT